MTEPAIYWILPTALAVTALVAYLAHHELNSTFDEARIRFVRDYKDNATVLDVGKGEAPPAWVAAQTLLQGYIATNSFQVKIIFRFSLLAMLVGFGITSYGVMSAVPHVKDPQFQFWPAALPTIAGVLTQFIGATFLFLVRITNQSAATFATILDRMNTVGMAVCVVRSIPAAADYDELRAKTYATMACDLTAASARTSAAASGDASFDVLQNAESAGGAAGARA